jgi:threonine dehydratase
LAALLSGRASPAAGSTVVCVISGGNVAPDVLKNLL